ncbi:MAG: hypothetical protein Q4D53_07510, partial [Leptotrichiaceae bacterium]|nr:hypothetical protein [Leptotrichiaceae bacterium]
FPELFDIKEKIENTSWKVADISGQKIKAELYTKKEIKTNGKEDIILSIKNGQIYGNIGLYGAYSGKYEISSRGNTISFKINEFKDLSESNKKVSEIEREFLDYLKEVRIINIIDENTLFMGMNDPDNYLVFKRYHLK